MVVLCLFVLFKCVVVKFFGSCCFIYVFRVCFFFILGLRVLVVLVMIVWIIGEVMMVFFFIVMYDFNVLYCKLRLVDDESEVNFLLGFCKESEVKEVDNFSVWVVVVMVVILINFWFL